jgi:large subunit ribosomal protein L5
MHFFENFYLKTVRYDLTNKYCLKNTNSIPKLKKIILNFNCWSKPLDVHLVASSMLALELIACQKSELTKTKFANLALRLRKGIPIGCKLTLKKEHNYIFLSKIVQEVSPSNKVFMLYQPNLIKNAFSFNIAELFNFNELEKQYNFFKDLNNLNVTVITNTNSLDELEFILKALKLPLKLQIYNNLLTKK